MQAKASTAVPAQAGAPGLTAGQNHQAGSTVNAAADNCKPTPGEANVRLSTAALLSARFPIISPAGHMHMDGKDNPRGDEVVDGGYFENSGLTTALDVAAALKGMGITPIVVSISNDPTVERVQQAKAFPASAAGPQCDQGPLALDVRRAGGFGRHDPRQGAGEGDVKVEEAYRDS